MRLLLVTTLYPNSAQPTRATYNGHHLQAIAALGHDVAVLAPVITFPGASLLGLTPRLPREETIEGITVWHPSFHRTPLLWRHYHHLMYRASVRRTFERLIDEWQPDHVLISFAYPDGAAMGPLCERLGLPWSLAVLGSDFLVHRWNVRLRDLLFKTLREAPLLFCPGRALKQSLVESGLPPSQIVEFPNGVDHDLFRCSSEPRQPYVLMVGNWVDVKGLDRLLAAWARLGRSDLELRLIGGGKREGALRQQCRDLGIEKQVVFIERQSREEIARQMQQATLFCLPSRSEGMPNVVLEALACGTPVVGSETGEIPYLIHPGHTGFLFPNRDEVTAELTEALRQALATEWDHQRIAESVAEYTWERAARAVMEPLQQRQPAT